MAIVVPTLIITIETKTSEVLTDGTGNTFTLRLIECPTCRVRDERYIGMRGGPKQRHGLGLPTRIVQCKRCSLLYPNPFPFPNNPAKLYGDPEKYFSLHDPRAEIVYDRKLVREMVKRTKMSRPSILDVGSGRGEFLHAAHMEGIEGIGLEFSPAMIEHARTNYGVNLLASSIEDYADSSERTFDVVILNAVLEHVYDPDSMIASVAKLTRPGGWVYIDIPNEPNLLTILGNALSFLQRSDAIFNLSPTWSPFHVYGFNQRALGILLRKHGLTIQECRVFACPEVASQGDIKDRLMASVATQVNRLSNWIGMASNLFVWARKGT